MWEKRANYVRADGYFDDILDLTAKTYDKGKPIVWPKKMANFFLGLLAERFRVTSLWENVTKMFLSGSFLGPAVQQVKLSIFHQALINAAHQTRLTFDLEIETTHGHSSSFRTRPHECR